MANRYIPTGVIVGAAAVSIAIAAVAGAIIGANKFPVQIVKLVENGPTKCFPTVEIAANPGLKVPTRGCLRDYSGYSFEVRTCDGSIINVPEGAVRIGQYNCGDNQPQWPNN